MSDESLAGLAAMMLVEAVVGMPKEDAQGTIVGNGFIFRVTRNDSDYFIITRDYNPKRINVWVVKNVIIRAYLG